MKRGRKRRKKRSSFFGFVKITATFWALAELHLQGEKPLNLESLALLLAG